MSISFQCVLCLFIYIVIYNIILYIIYIYYTLFVCTKCPIPGKFKTMWSDQVTASYEQNIKPYVGLVDSFQLSCKNKSLKSGKCLHNNALSKYVWHLKDNKVKHNISCKFLSKASTYSVEASRCNLCLWEFFLLFINVTCKSIIYRYHIPYIFLKWYYWDIIHLEICWLAVPSNSVTWLCGVFWQHITFKFSQ